MLLLRRLIYIILSITLFVNVDYIHATIITIDTSIKYQTIRGWGASSYYPEWISDENRKELIDVLVNELGINRLRLEFPSGNRSHDRAWEWENDDTNPFNYNWDAFNLKRLDDKIEKFILPIKEKVEARGDPFDMYVSPSFFNGGSSGAVPAWLLNSPGEYSEFATSILVHLKEKYGIEANYFCILNEAGNNNPFTSQIVSDMIKTLCPRMEKAGLKTRIQFPECISASESWKYIDAMKNDSIMLSYVDVLSYHLYGTNDPYRSMIRDYARERGKITAQTEYMNLNMNILYDDMTKGETSYWEIYGIGSCIELKYDRMLKLQNFWNFRQVFNYVRPGAVRIAATSDDSTLKVLAFIKNEKPTVVIINGSFTKYITLENLVNGYYGISRTINGKDYTEKGIYLVDDGSMTIQVVNSVTTIYPYNGNNHAPAATSRGANTDYLTLPDNKVTLSAAATDAEEDSLNYSWLIKMKPNGANPIIKNPSDSITEVTEMNEDGKYIFEVTISDGINSVRKEIRVNVFAKNQAPIPVDVHNRNPVQITLPADTTVLRASSWDMENDTRSYTWSIISQPDGSDVKIEDTTKTSTKLRNIAKAGDFAFQIKISDGTNTVFDTLKIPVFPVNNNAPIINNITAKPAKINLPITSTQLYSEADDLDGDLFTLWWSVKSSPAGTNPVFAEQASSITDVFGLDTVGGYTFTLTAIDRTKKSSKDVTVTVERITNNNENLTVNDYFGVYPNPADEYVVIRFEKEIETNTNVIISDIFGRIINKLKSEEAKDNHKIIWDCKDLYGKKVSQGYYQLIIKSGNDFRVKPVIIE